MFKKLCAFAFIGLAMPVAAETIDNSTIIMLTKAGLSEGLIIDKINSLPCGYDVAIDKLIFLKQSGVSDFVTSAMVRRCATLADERGIAGDSSSPDPLVKHAPGIYLMANWTTPNKLQVLRPSKSSGMKSTGNGSVIFPFMYKMVVSGNVSRIQVPNAMPAFYFYFNVSDAKVSDFGLENSLAAQSPDEFSLVRLKQKGDSREIVIGKASFYEGMQISARKGVDPKNTIAFSTDSIGSGIFKVTPSNSLPAGEYAFLFTGSNTSARVYEFSIASLSPPEAAVEKTSR